MWFLVLSALLPLLDTRPPADDLKRFPPYLTALDELNANSIYHAHIRARRDVELVNWWRLTEIMDETDISRNTWNSLLSAHNCGVSRLTVNEKRNWLALLREQLGPEMYQAGHMLPAVPFQRLTYRD